MRETGRGNISKGTRNGWVGEEGEKKEEGEGKGNIAHSWRL